MFQHADQTQIQFPHLATGITTSWEPSLDQVLNSVAQYFNINRSAMKSRRKSESLRIPRQIAMYLCLQWTTSSYSEIGKFFAERHGTTIRRQCLQIQQLVQENRFFQTIVTDISRNIPCAIPQNNDD